MDPGSALEGVPHDWPTLLGCNQLTAKPEAEVLADCGDDPLLAVGRHGVGRSAAFASDCAPHWAAKASRTGQDTTRTGCGGSAAASLAVQVGRTAGIRRAEARNTTGGP